MSRIFTFLVTRIVVALLFAAGISFFAPRYASASALSKPVNNLGLVGYWNFEEGSGLVAGDYSGNGNGATLTNGPTWAVGKSGRALSFDGSNDYAITGNSAILRPTSAVTLSAWIKTTNGKDIVGAGLHGYGLQLDSSHVYWYTYGNTNGYAHLAGTTLNNGQWHHLVGTWDSSGPTSKIYIDGVDIGATIGGTLPTSLDYTYNNFYIGDNPGGGLGLFTGSIDEVRVYNRALSASEVAALYQQGVRVARAKTPNTTGLVGYWNFEEGKGATAGDSSGNGNEGTLTNGPTWVKGRIGSAISFDGSNDYIVTPTVSTFASTDDHSYAAWVKASALPSQAYAWIIDNGDVNTSGSSVIVCKSGSVLQVGAIIGGNTVACSTNTFSVGDWHHIIAAYSASANKYSFYIDGVFSNQSSVMGSWSSVSTQRHIGAWTRCCGGYYFAGAIDDARIYNRTLSATDAAALYQQTGANRLGVAHNTVGSSNLIGWWTFDGSKLNSTTALDSSGNANDATLNGASGAQNKPQPVPGRIGQGLHFDGTDDYLSLSVQMPTSTYTKTAWIRLDPNAGSSDNNFISGSEHALWAPSVYSLKLSAGHNGAWNAAQDTVPLELGRWYFVSATYDSSVSNGTLILYKNGVSVATATNISPPSAYPVALRLGAYSAGGNVLYGDMDDARVYNRVLSASEILQLYNMGK